MNSSAKNKSSPKSRHERYKPIIDYVAEQTCFGLKDVKQACSNEKPSFVTRVVNELERNGWIVREDGTRTTEYRWNKGRGEFSASRWLDEQLYGTQITESPAQERPRERLLSGGVENMKDSELLAILIRSGRPGESAVMAGEKVAKAFCDRLKDLASAGRGELKSISPAIEKTAFCQIMAGIELGRRIASVSERSAAKIRSATDAIAYCRKHFARLATDARQEEFHIVTLDTKNQVVDTHQITVGTLDASLVHPREVFRPAIKDAAAAIILVHNHPSGDPTPSPEDMAVTRRLESAGELLGINVLDHIIVGSNAAVSIRELGE